MRYLFCISFIFLSWTLSAQKVQFVAESNATDVVLGNAFRVSFRLENAEIQKINFPDFEQAGFRIMNGPMHARQYTNINGKASASESYSFVLAPSKTGKLTIGRAQARAAGGRVLNTKPIVINCVKASKSGGNADRHNLPSSIAGKVLFQVEADRKKAVVGEQVTLYFNIYTKIDISSIELTDEPDFENEYSYPIRYYNKGARIAVVNGQQYATKTIHAMGVFPAQEGVLRIEPAKMRIALGAVDPFNPFSKGASYELRSEAIEIPVESLMGKNSDFTGGVGEYEMQAYVEEDEVSTDDMLKLTMRIQGKGDLKQILPPKIKMDGRRPFQVYDPKIEEEIKEGKMGLGGTKTFSYNLEPQAVGELKITPNFTYYDTRKRKFVTIDTIFKINVKQGQRKVGEAAVEEAEVQDSIQQAATLLEFKAPLNKARWTKAQKPLFGSLFFWLMTLSPLALFWIIFGLARLKNTRDRKREEALERTKAERLAKEQLAKAQEFLLAQDSSNFFQTIESTLKEYLGEKLKLSGAEISTDKIIAQLKARAFEEEITTELKGILQVCEESVYAAQNNEQTMQDTYKRSKKLLKMFNKSLNKNA
jgi:hypothetical protein